MAATTTVTLEIPTSDIHAVAGVLDMLAHERRTPTGAVSRSGRGEFTYREGFRETMSAVADGLRAAARDGRGD